MDGLYRQIISLQSLMKILYFCSNFNIIGYFIKQELVSQESEIKSQRNLFEKQMYLEIDL